MRLDSVEIKVTLSGDQVARAVSEFGLPDDRPEWAIYFGEDVTREISPDLPMLGSGIVFRIREKADRTDATVKLRPCHRSQLTDRWLAAEKDDGWEFKVEADWAGQRRVLAASLTADLPDGGIDTDRSLRDLLTAQQHQFLDECANVRVNLDVLTLLPPVTAVRWDLDPMSVGDIELEVRGERWVVDALDFVELSVVADPDDAERKQAALEYLVRSRGFSLAAGQETKTRLVLEYLVAASLR